MSFRSHNAEHEIWQTLAKHVKNPVKKMYFLSLANRLKRMAAFYCDKFDLLVPISARDLDYYRSAGCSKPAIVCSTGYNLENKGRPSVSQERNSLFYIGSLDWLPNQQGLIWFVEKVYRDLIKTHPSLKFHIAGRNASWGFLKRIEHPDVIYHGEVDDSADFISNWGICIVPLFAGSGIRIKIIESMALGRPVVATSKAAEGLEVTDKENILIADTPSDFVRCISAILNDDALYDSLSAEGRKLVESFYNRDKIAGSLIEFYNLCLP